MPEYLPRRSDGLLLSRDSDTLGLHESFRTARQAQRIVALRRGVYAPSEVAAGMSAIARYRATVLAAGHQRRQPVFAGFSAAVLWGLPVVQPIPREVYLIATGTSGRRRNGVVEFARRDGVLCDELDGLVLTALPDTLIDVARTMPLMTALVMVDAALHESRFSRTPALCTREELYAAYSRRLPFPGSARVLAVLVRGTTLADSVLETVSRVHVEQLGFPRPLGTAAVGTGARDGTASGSGQSSSKPGCRSRTAPGADRAPRVLGSAPVRGALRHRMWRGATASGAERRAAGGGQQAADS